MRELLAPVAVLAACAGALGRAQEPPAAPACALSEGDSAWLARALEAWRYASREIAGIESVPPCRAVIFDGRCVLTSDEALVSRGADGVTWSAAPHGGAIPLPDGGSVEVGVTSYASGDASLFYFVMSTPSVWSAGGVGQGPDLEATMVGVLLHEASHVAQLGPYGARLAKLIEENALPDSFDDNAVQDRFGSEREFAASIDAETQKYFAAAAAADDTEARLLAYEARELAHARRARWFVGADAYLAEAEDVWLTFEGAGQWLAYRWLTDPKGGGQAPGEMLRRLSRGDWSQTQGFALVLALDRIAGPGWKRHAFGDGAETVPETLDAALAE